MDLGANAELLGNVGEFLGAIGVVISLVFVGYSITQNTKATRAQTFHPDFRAFLDNSAPPNMRSFADLIQTSNSV